MTQDRDQPIPRINPPTTFSWKNIFADTPGTVLAVFALLEAAVAVTEAAGWLDQESVIWARILPFVQLFLSHFKLFFSRRLQELGYGKTFVVTTNDPNATVNEIETPENGPGD